MEHGKVAVVTGGSVGVGRATVQRLAAMGYDVGVIARGNADLAGAVADVEQAGRRALALNLDVTDEKAMNQAVSRVERELGEIYAWVNVAFIGTLAFSWDSTLEEFKRVMDVTFFGQVNGTMVALRVMRPRNHGVIVNVGSAMAYRSIPLQAPYCAAKRAAKGFSESVMTELAHEKSKVKLCMVQLSSNTPQFDWNLHKMANHPMPVSAIYEPELAAKAICHLIEHPRRNMWVGLPTATTNFVERFMPKLLDLYLGRSRLKSQQTSKDVPRHGANLWEPRDQNSDAGPNDAFDEQAHPHDPVLWAALHRREIFGGVAAVGAAVVAAAAVSAKIGARATGKSASWPISQPNVFRTGRGVLRMRLPNPAAKRGSKLAKPENTA